MLIAISGTPGTGKTKTAQILAKLLKADVITMDYLVKKYKIRTKMDAKRNTKIIDEKKLAAAVAREAKLHKTAVFENHMAHLVRANVKIILRTSPRVLEKRLKARGWSDKKIKENVEAEALGIISSESKGLEIDTTRKTPKQSANVILKIVRGRKINIKKIDWMKAYEKYLRG